MKNHTPARYTSQEILKVAEEHPGHDRIPRLIRGLNISSGAKLVYANVIGRANRKTRICFPSLTTIGEDCGMHRDTVRTLTVELKDAGLIEIKPMGRSYRYTIPQAIFDAIDSANQPYRNNINDEIKDNNGSKLQQIGGKIPHIKNGNGNDTEEMSLIGGKIPHGYAEKPGTNVEVLNVKDKAKVLCPAKNAEPIPYGKIITDLNLKAGKNFKPSSEATRELIRARWGEGWRLDDFKKVHTHQSDNWKDDPEWDKYLRPKTLYRRSNFEGYLNAPPRAASESGPSDYSTDLAIYRKRQLAREASGGKETAYDSDISYEELVKREASERGEHH